METPTHPDTSPWSRPDGAQAGGVVDAPPPAAEDRLDTPAPEDPSTSTDPIAPRPASPQPPPAAWGELDAGPGSPIGSVRPPDTTGTVETPPAPSGARRPFAVGLLGAVVGAVLGTAGTLAILRTTPAFTPGPSAPVEGPAIAAPVVQPAGPGSDGAGVVTAVAAAVTPSVVRIDVATEERDPESGDLVNVPVGLGSGVIYRSDGYILTNNHVVEQASAVQVRFSDGEAIAAEIVGTDPLTDLAVLKVDRTGLPAINLRNDTPDVGETAIAIGTPFGLDASVTAGVVSAVNRDLEVPAQGSRPPMVIPSVLQTDAAINPGNSGGALVDGTGRLIGINTAIYTGSGGSQGVGFAVTTRSAVSSAEQLISKGFVAHPYLGVGGVDVSREIARRYEDEFGIELQGGAVIENVTRGSGAADAGMETGDVVVAVDGEDVEDMTDLVVLIRQYRAGDRVEITVLRDGERLDLDVQLGERPR
jgi:serine protease Do